MTMIDIFFIVNKLKKEAKKTDKTFITKNDNYEIINVEDDFKYIIKMNLYEFRV